MTVSTQITFRNPEGQRLSGVLESPDHMTDRYALYAHCFACPRESAAAAPISRALADVGVAVLRIDSGRLDSEGKNSSASADASRVSNLLAAETYMREHLASPRLLIGHGVGGAAALAAAGDMESVRATAVIGAPLTAQVKEKLNGLRCALLVLHAPADAEVPVAEAHGVFEAAKHPKSFIALDGADHLLSHEEDVEYAARLLSAWSWHYCMAP